MMQLSYSQNNSRAYKTGIFVFCGKELPKNFSYLIEKKSPDNKWIPVAQLKSPQSELECKASLMQLPATIAAITPVDQSTIAFLWNRIQHSTVIDSLFLYSTDPRYQYMAQTAWFDEGIKNAGMYAYRIKRLNKDGSMSVLNEVSVQFPSQQSVSNISPVRFKINEKSISISYEVTNPEKAIGIKLYRSLYLRNDFSEIPAKMIYTSQKDKMVAVLTDPLPVKGLTYSYMAQAYDDLANIGKMSDTLNINFVAKASDIGLITNFKITPQPDKAGNLLKWDFNNGVNVNTIDVYRSDEYNGNYTLIASVNPTKREYFDSRNLQPAVVYFYYIAINTGIGSSLPSPRAPAILEGKVPNTIEPQDLTLTKNGNIVSLHFRNIDRDSRAYYIYRGDGYRAELYQLPRMLLSTESLLTYTDTLPQSHNAAVYSYAVASVNTSYNISPLSNRVSVSYSGGRLPVPYDVNTVIDNKKIIVTWADATKSHSGLTGYRVFRKTSFKYNVENQEKLIAETGLTNNSFVDSLVIPQRYYTYRVQCVGEDSTDIGSMSQAAGILYHGEVLLQPGNVSVIPSEKKIILKWTLPIAENLVGTQIYRSIEGGKPTLIKETDATTESFEDTTAKVGTLYYYIMVIKYNNNLTSKPTNAVGAKWQIN